MGPNCPIKSPPILGGTSSPTDNLFEVILLLTGCLYTGILLSCFTCLTKLRLLRKYPQRVLDKLSLGTLPLAEREFRASRVGRRRPETQPSRNCRVHRKVREKSLASAISNKHRKAKKSNKAKRHIANDEMNTQRQNTKAKQQHHYTSQKHQCAPIQSPKINKPAKQQKPNKKASKNQKTKNQTNMRRKEEVGVQG
jgi:hypothetical protein